MKSYLIITLLFASSLAISQTENFWTKKADYTGLKRERAVAFTINDYAYVGTGVDTAEQVRKDFWKYDPIFDSWTQISDFPGSARRNAVAFTANDMGYVGTGIDNSEATLGTILTDFWEYNPTTNTWSYETDYPSTPVYFATGFSVENKGYVVCGKRGPNNYCASLFQYDPLTGIWSQGPDFPGGVRYQLSSFVIENSAYVGLGTDQDMYRNDIWQYKPSQNQWTEKASLPASERSGSHTFTLGYFGYVCMGTNGGYLDDLWEYNPYDNSWSVKCDYGGTKRKNGVGFALLGKGYIGTGKGYSGKKQSFHEYTPSSYVGLKEMANQPLGIYPNPAQNNVNLQSNGDIATIEMYSFTGQLVAEYEFASSISLNAPPGSYLLVGKDGQGKIKAQQKLMIQ